MDMVKRKATQWNVLGSDRAEYANVPEEAADQFAALMSAIISESRKKRKLPEGLSLQLF